MAIYLDVQKEKKATRKPFRTLSNFLFFICFTLFAVNSYSFSNHVSIKVLLFTLLAILYGTLFMNSFLFYIKNKRGQI